MTEFLERGAEHFHLGIDGWQVSSASLQEARSLLTRERSHDRFLFAFSGKGKVFPPGKRGEKARSLFTGKGREKARSLLTRNQAAEQISFGVSKEDTDLLTGESRGRDSFVIWARGITGLILHT